MYQVTKHRHKLADGAHSLLLLTEQRRRLLFSNYLASRKNNRKHAFGISGVCACSLPQHISIILDLTVQTILFQYYKEHAQNFILYLLTQDEVLQQMALLELLRVTTIVFISMN
jgi:hypothetical protein